MRADRLVSAGYLVVRPAGRPRYLDSATFPERLVSASDHVAPVLPVVPPGWLEAVDAPPGRFSGFADAAQGNLLWALQADLGRFGLDGSLAADMSEWLSVAFARGDFHPPSAFATLEAACRFVECFGPVPEDTLIVGLGLGARDVAAVAKADEGVTYLSRLPACDADPADGGAVLGWDLYRVDDSELVPWVREPGAVDRLVAAGLRPNAAGLFTTAAEAERALRLLGESDGAGHAWRAWCLFGHELAPG